jgi:outer membrane receptor protein involved in Fe transport
MRTPHFHSGKRLRALGRRVLCLLLLSMAVGAQARGLERVRFVVVDPHTRRPLAGAQVTIEDPRGVHPARTLWTGLRTPAPTCTFDLRTWTTEETTAAAPTTVISLPVGVTVTLQGQTQPPVQDIYIRVTAHLIPMHANPIAPGTTLNSTEIKSKAGVGGGVQKLIEGTTGVASDSAGQQHVRGEHADISYVVDGVPLPDTLSGRQGSVVVPATIQRLEILTGGFAPEFGGQTAAILNVTTLPGASRSRSDLALEGGSYETTNGDFTTVGPLSKFASYVFDINGTRTRNYLEPQQPDVQTAHNAGSSLSYFSKLRFAPSHRDTLSLALSSNPDTYQISNRMGLPDSFAQAGQGFGFLGLRNANGVRPDVTDANKDALGAQTLPLSSQQAAGQDIFTREASEFATLSWQRQLAASASGLLAFTFLHAGQDLRNHNPPVDVQNLPVDNSIEYNPTTTRNIHHVQINSSLTYKHGSHEVRAGLLLDDQNGDESYNVVPASSLALDELAALAPNLAPPGSVKMDAQGNPVTDVNGNPVYAATGPSPTLTVHRSGFYRAAYLQDTWQASHRLTINYGLRADWYKQIQNLGQPIVDIQTVYPRFNFSYNLDRLTTARWSYDRLLNTPPLAQGAILGQPIAPETLSQYDISIERQVGSGQTVSLAYYIKDIRNQVDTGLLIPGSQIGLYSAVNFQVGGVHGIELAYDLTPRHNVGLSASLNYSYSIARPNGVDNTGTPVPDFNDHDQRNTVGMELGYTWKSGFAASLVLNHGSGLASSTIPPGALRTPRTRLDLHLATGPRLFGGHGGLSMDVENLLDDRAVINYQSAFSGTRFQPARRILLSINGSF